MTSQADDANILFETSYGRVKRNTLCLIADIARLAPRADQSNHHDAVQILMRDLYSLGIDLMDITVDYRPSAAALDYVFGHCLTVRP